MYQAYENEGKSLLDQLLIFLMYFTYCRLWIPVVAWAFYDDFVSRGDPGRSAVAREAGAGDAR